MRLLPALLLAACAEDEAPWDPAAPGPHAAGVSTTTLPGERAAPLTVWYPTDAAPGDVSLAALVPDAVAGALADAPAGCPTTTLPLARDAAPLPGPWPLAVLSHCHQCQGGSLATLAGRLASHGWVVVAVDHVGNTLDDALAGDGGQVGNPWLDIRVADVTAALDDALSGDALPDGLAVDPARLAVAGHSFGAMTTGRVLAERPDVVAGVALFAPYDVPLYDTADAAALAQPVMTVLATEDHSILEVGNALIADNRARQPAPAYALDVVDAGHWSVSDLLAVVPEQADGCGDGDRLAAPAETFSFPAPAAVRELVATEVLTFLEATLTDREAAWERLRGASDATAQRKLRE